MSAPTMPLSLRRSRRVPAPLEIVSLVLSLALLVVILYPLIATLARSFIVDGTLDLSPFATVLSDPQFLEAARNTGILFVTAGTLAIIVGSFFAWVNERTDARMGRIATLLPLVTFFIPTIGMAIGWMFLGQETVGYVNVALRAVLGLFGVEAESGPLNIASWPGMIFMYTVELVPYVYLIMSAALRNVDPSLEEASRMSGAGAARTALRVSLPSVAPALGSAALMVLLVSISLLSIPLTIGTTARIPVLSVYVVRLSHEIPGRIPEVVAISVLIVIVVTAAVLLNYRMGRGSRHATIGGKSGGGAVVKLGPLGWVARGLMIAYLLIAAVLPILALVVVALQPYWSGTIDFSTLSFQHFGNFLFAPFNQARSALVNSLELGLIAATVLMLFATITVTYAAQSRKSIVSGAIRFGTKLPSAISHLVIAISLLIALGGAPFFLKGSYVILVIAYLVIYIPQASISAESARAQVGEELLEASTMAGAGSARTMSRIMTPLMAPGLVSGWALVFVLVFGELTAAAILSGPSNLVVGAVIFNIWDSGIFAQLAVLGTAICVVTGAVVGTVMLVRPRRRGRRRPLPQIETPIH
ncbi:ABC transporter permease [Microbacterium ulmi]|uniref:Iron ABC transporter permease n=1 Tax=Microbacterium ulmi TaxID=179095 RepID=A0A7Y2M152_9MICO|nr:iron ABC transporter permease [Microbacterium ulmi]NII69960.1 iron(III) transport system permease protein [Microbacterium ulmi]NNH03879.1 iron ABC transporter permease [Microbacterium ulmi]